MFIYVCNTDERTYIYIYIQTCTDIYTHMYISPVLHVYLLNFSLYPKLLEKD